MAPGRRKNSKNKLSLKNTPTWAVVILVLVVVGSAMAGIFAAFGLNITPLDPNVPPVDSPTSFIIVANDYLDSSNTDDLEDALTYAWYGADISSMTTEEIEDLTWSNFALEDADDDDFTPDEDNIYILKVSGTDVVTRYYCTDERIFDGQIPLVALGTNQLYLMNETEDVSQLAFSDEALTTTVNQTDYRDWSVQLNCLDGSEGSTANMTAKQGYLPYFDPSANEFLCVILEIEFNSTASTSWITIESDYDVAKSASGNYLYLEFHDLVLFGSVKIELRTSTGLGSTYEMIGVVTSYGYDASNTDWDSQN